MRAWCGLGLAAAALAAQMPAQALPPPTDSATAPVSRVGITAMPRTAPMPVPGGRPLPPPAGSHRCIGVNNVAGAVVFGEVAVELTMKDGRRWRLYFAQACPTLTFYSGFYYRRAQAGQLCAGKDAVISRAGGECAIASIMPVRHRPAARPRR